MMVKKTNSQKKEDSKSNIPKNLARAPINERDIALDFAEKVHKKFDRMIKASVLFGSQTKHTANSSSDIDIVLIIDDAAINWDLELISWYREELSKLIAAQDYPRELHINTVKLTTWWQDLLNGDPVVINILRYGDALIDSGGFFNPLKELLLQGKMHSTPEAVYAALQRAPAHLARSKSYSTGAIEGVYWTIVDSSQAALMTAGRIPPSPEHIPLMLKETFVDSGKMDIEFVKHARDIYALHKALSHGEIKSLKGSEVDEWQVIAEKFLKEITNLIEKVLEEKAK